MKTLKPILKATLLGIVFLSLFANVSFAQGSVSGNPASEKWMQINTDTLRVIFPEYMSVKAQRVSDYIHHLAANNSESLGGKVRKISIVLQANSSTPNGYVSVAPYKSEFYCTNPQDPYMVGGDDFMDVLSIHEYRHALQYANTKRGFANVLYLLQGEQGWAIFANLTVPNWFFEGDAVVNETALSNSGRGRLSAFQKNNHANWNADKHFKYKHMRMGSYKHSMPNHYEYGYLLSSYLRDEYGNDIWAKVLKNTSKLRGVIYPFSNALRMHTGLSTRKLYEKAYAHYEKQYKQMLSEMQITEGEKISLDANEITNYTFPTYENNDLYALKSSYSRIPEIVKLSKNGDEDIICQPSNTANSGFSIANGKIAYSEYTPHPRWDNYNYSDIVIYDIASKKSKTISKNAKYFSPQLSKDGKRLVVVELTNEQACTLLILDTETGQVLKQLNNKDNDYLMYPKWINDNEIICSGRKKGKFNITTFDINKNTETLVWDPKNQVITDIEIANDSYYFSATFSGIDQIYKMNPKNGNVTQVTEVPVGAYWPSISSDGEHLVFANVKAEGSELRKITLSKAVNKRLEIQELHEMKIFESEAIRAEGGSIIESTKHRNDAIKKYNRLGHLIKIHSWGVQASNEELGLNIKSENDLNTFGAEAAYTYNLNEKSNALNANLTYAGFWIKPMLSFSTVKDRDYGFFGKQQFDEQVGRFSLALPLNFSSGIYHRNLSLSSGVSGHTLKFKKDNLALEDHSFTDYDFTLSFYNIKSSAYKNIAPRWGQSISFSYHKSFEQDKAEQLEAQTRFYLPGLLKNHNLELASAYKWKGTAYGYTDRFEYSRGFSTQDYKKILSVSADYNLPVAYPEFGINGIFYTNRLSSKLFADYNITDFDESSIKKEYTSVGFEALFDVLIGNFINAQIGCRQAFLLNKDDDTSKNGSAKFEFVFRVTP